MRACEVPSDSVVGQCSYTLITRRVSSSLAFVNITRETRRYNTTDHLLLSHKKTNGSSWAEMSTCFGEYRTSVSKWKCWNMRICVCAIYEIGLMASDLHIQTGSIPCLSTSDCARSRSISYICRTLSVAIFIPLTFSLCAFQRRRICNSWID